MKSKALPNAIRPLKFLGRRIVLGITGSIAAYKAAGLVRALIKEGAEVPVVMTESAKRFVAPLTFEVLSKHPVASDLFNDRQEMPHLTLSEQADAILIAPATANVLAKCASGLADDLLSTLLLNARCPVIFAPAMDGDMWHHPAVQGNVETLRKRGAVVLDPEYGELASGAVAMGRLPADTVILGALEAHLTSRLDWAGQRVLISAGPTQEAIDAVRFISNRSSGKMGYALAQAARERGAEVVLISGPTALSSPAGVEVVPIRTAREMHQALVSRFPWSTVVIMAAAVADFRPKHPASGKLKKHPTPVSHLELEPTEDILEHLSQMRQSQQLVGFAAETEALLQRAKDKLKRKQLDLIVANNVSAEGSGFESDTNAAILIDRNGTVTELAIMPKRQLADRILDALRPLQARDAHKGAARTSANR